MNFEVKTFSYTSPDYPKSVELRNKILRKPLGIKFTPAEMEQDKYNIHLGIFDDERILACLVLTDTGDKRIKMRQVSVDEDMQGKGLGRQLSIAAENYARENNYEVIFCHARKSAVPFYQKLGYTTTSDEFTEVNIPHYAMEKQLA